MQRKKTIGNAILAGAALATGSLSQAEEASRQPYRNLVFILIDDLGAIDLGCTGSTYYRTPNIDALAKRGMRFTQAYAASGVCSPTRASIVTGRYPHRSRITSYIPGPGYPPHARLVPPPNAQTLADGEVGYAAFLHEAGVRSLHVGKWHLGHRSPEQLGFDEAYHSKNPLSAEDPWAVSEYTDRVCEFIRECGDDRFLAVLSHHTVHVPIYEKEENIARWEGVPPGGNEQNNPTMAAMIESMDSSVGRVVQTLKESGRGGDTAIVFFSDNGGLERWKPPGEEAVVVATSNAPLRGGKSQLYEGGIRVPLIIAAPGLTDKGGTCAVPVISNDLAPTFLALLGAKPQTRQHLDGVDLSPLLDGGEIPARTLFWYYPHYQALPPHAAVLSDGWKLVHHYDTGESELYHLPTDIGEETDLAAKLPETTKILVELLERHLAHMKVPLPKQNPEYDPERERQGKKMPVPAGNIGPVVATPDTNLKRSLVDELRQRHSPELPAIVSGPRGIPSMATSVASRRDDQPVVGAIRWDAWTGGAITEQVERTLGPEKYHNRLPWFAEVIDESTVRIDGGHQEVMDREIEFAAVAGLDYWAFLVYGKGNVMSAALEQYLKSKKRKQIRFCLILHNTLKVSDDQWPMERDRAVALLQEPGYQMVLDNRPLVYAFTGQNFPFARFQQFLAAAKAKGLNPYCVYMGWNPAVDYKKVKDIGFDAVSAYARGGNQPTFTALAEAVEEGYWQNAAKAGVPYIPLVTTGWDKRPRKDNPVSWEKGQPYHKQDVFPSRPTPTQIAKHLKGALDFVGNHPEICHANAVIIYAWNEYDEGGWIAPTRGADGEPDNGRLEAIKEVLRD